MSAPSANSLCPECGRPIAPDSLGGACAACAWQIVTAEETSPAAADASPLPAEDAGGAALFHVEGHDVLAEIARGGAGVVFRALQRSPHREVAFKMLQPQQMGSDEMVTRFRIEAETIASLDHPAILPVYTVGVHREMPFFTMKLATGGTLAGRRIAYRGQWRRIARLVAELADAVQFAHSRGVIHRDLKPGNILFDEADRPFVSDFGLAKYTGADAGVTRTLNLLGTPAYLAPEVAQRGAPAATTASDTYALGAMLYELLVQQPPFAADSLSALLREIAETPPAPPRRRAPGVPADLEVICLRCLAKEPTARPGSAGELAAELRRWLDGVPIHSRPVSTAERVWQWCRRRPALAGLGTALVVTVATAGVLQWRAHRSLAVAFDDARQKLHATLVSESALRADSRTPGQRDAPLALLAQAAAIRSGPEVRSGVATALTRDDLRLVRELPAEFPDPQATMAFTPDFSAYLAPAPGGFALRSASDGAVVRAYATGGATPRVFRFSRDAQRFSVFFADGTAKVWFTDETEPAWTTPAATPLALHPAQPAVAYWAENTLRERSLRDGTERTIARDLTQVFSLSYGPAGGRIAVVRATSLDLIATADGAAIWSQPDAVLATTSAWSDDGLQFLTANRTRNALDVRDAATGLVRQTLAGHTSLPQALAFLPSRQRALSLGFDGTLQLWDVATGRALLQVPARPRDFTRSADGTRLALATSADRPAIFEWAAATVWREFAGAPLAGAFPAGADQSADGRWIITGALEAVRRPATGFHTVHATVWDTRREAAAATFQFTAGREDRITLAFDPKDRGLIYAAASTGMRRRRLDAVEGRAARVGPEVVVSPPGRGTLHQVHPGSGDWIVRRPVMEPTFMRWPAGQVARATPLALEGRPLPANAIVDLDHATLPGAAEREFRFWSLQTGSYLGQLTIPSPGWAGFSTAGDVLVTVSKNTFRVFAVPGVRPLAEWPVREDGHPVKQFAFSRSGRWFANESGGSALELRDGRTFALVARVEPPLDLEMNHLAWSPDESRLHVCFRGPRVFALDVAALLKEFAARGLGP